MNRKVPLVIACRLRLFCYNASWPPSLTHGLFCAFFFYHSRDVLAESKGKICALSWLLNFLNLVSKNHIQIIRKKCYKYQLFFLSIEKFLQVWERETEGRGSDEKKRVLGLESGESTEGTLTECPLLLRLDFSEEWPEPVSGGGGHPASLLVTRVQHLCPGPRLDLLHSQWHVLLTSH